MWSEGMFIGPHHFQQQDRFMLQSMAALQENITPYAYGLKHLEIDEQALSEGKFSVRRCEGIFTDGTPFSLPQDGPLPDPLQINSESAGEIISIGLPFSSHSEKEIAETRDRQSFARYLLQHQRIGDAHSPDSDTEESVFTAAIWVRLRFSGSDETAYHTIPVARVQDCKEDGTVVLDRSFYPCAMFLRASADITRLCGEIDALLTQRGTDLAKRLHKPDSGDSAQLTEFFILQLINRAKPLLQHVLSTDTLHPEALYRELVQLAGELSTYCRADKLCRDLPHYNHSDQSATFQPLCANIRESLNFTVDQTVISFSVEHIKGGIYTCTVAELALFRTARFILAVNARIPQEELRQQFVKQTTIASKDKLRDLVTSHVSGIKLTPVLQVPNNIPMYDNHLYFEMDNNIGLWGEIATTGVIAMHIAGNFPELQMQLWTLNQ